MFEQAKKKLDDELKSGKFDRYASVMKQRTHDTLVDFCRQDEEFAQAVVQGGSFSDCMAAVAKKVNGNTGISDMEAYGEAVRFYFPGAGIQVTMKIDLCASVRKDEPAPADKPDGLVIDLSDFFG